MHTLECWKKAKRILCVRLDGIGDLLMTTPAIRAFKQSVSGRRVTLLTSSAAAEAAFHIPEIDDVIIYDAPWMKATTPRTDSRLERAMAEFLKPCGFDGAVIFTAFSQNPMLAAFLCQLAEIPLRLAHCHENPYQMLTDWVPDPEPSQTIRHEVKRQLDLAAFVGNFTDDRRLSLKVPEAARLRVLRIFEKEGIRLDGPWIVIHPGAAAPSLIREARLLISNNTGPAHIAAAVGTPVVDLYALTNPQHTPWGVPSRVLFHDVPCKFCYRSICPEGHHDCLRLVSPDEVVAAARELSLGKQKLALRKISHPS